MESFIQVLENALAKNKDETTKWTTYLEEYTQLDKNMKDFAKHLEVDVMVPVVSNKALFPGKLYHTGEVTINHGSNLYSKCSTHQALQICGHRLKAARDRLAQLNEENEMLTNKLELPFDQSAFATKPNEKEIIETYNEEEEKRWREKHKASLRKMKAEERRARLDNKTSEDIFEKLNELEMMEELENELERLEVTDEVTDTTVKELVKGEVLSIGRQRKSHQVNKHGEVQFTTEMAKPKQIVEKKECVEKSIVHYDLVANEYVDRSEIISLEDQTKTCSIPKKLEIFQIRLNDIIQQLEALKGVKETPATLEQRADLDEIKDYLEDQLEKLQPDSENDYQSVDSELSMETPMSTKRRNSVSFAISNSIQIMDNIEKTSELLSKKTLKLKFTHSDHKSDESTTRPYDINELVRSPADIYVKFAHCLTATRRKSILKNKEKIQEETIIYQPPDTKEAVAFGDVVERVPEDIAPLTAPTTVKPAKVSKFKQSRKK